MHPPRRPTTLARLTTLLEQAARDAAADRGDRSGPVWIGRPPKSPPKEGEPPFPVNGPPSEPGGLPLPLRALHEWLAEAPPQSLWTAAAQEAADRHPGAVFWVGPACWPWAAPLPAGLRARSVFVNAPRRDPAARVWAVDLLLHSPAAAAVVADGRGLSTAASRRLQLAAEAGDALALLWRADDERGPSAAHYRWRVTPRPTPDHHPRWRVERLRGKDAAACLTPCLSSATHGSTPMVFDVEMRDAEGLVAVPDPVADRPSAADAAPRPPGAGTDAPDRRSA